MPTTLVMLMIRPQRRLIIPRAACLVTRKAPFRLVFRTVSQSSSPIRNNKLSRVVPALLTTTSMRPKSFSTAATVVSTCCASLTSQPYPRPPPPPSPPLPSDAAASRALATSLPSTATREPTRASPWAMACPIPRLPPVTTATFPVRSIFMRSRRVQEPRDLVGGSKGRDTRRRHDAAQQTREHGAGADLDEARLRARELGGALHARDPADRGGELIGEEAARACGVADRLRGRVGDDGERGVAKRRALEGDAQLVRRRRHEGRVERAAHVQGNDALRPARLAELSGPQDGGGIARDDGLVGTVEVRGHGDGAAARRLTAGGFDLRRREPQDRGHGAGPLGARPLHEFAAPPDERRRVGRRERAGGHVRGVFAERVTRGRDRGAVNVGAYDRKHRRAVRQNRGLRVLGRGELILRAVEHQRAEGEPEGPIDGLERRPRLREPFGEVFCHPDFLCALPGAEPHGGYHCTTRLAHVKPAPNAQNITFMPGCSRPQRTASSSAIATDAADVFPYRSTLT